MNNYAFLSKPGLRYLIKYDNVLSSRLQRELVEYADANKVKLHGWHAGQEEWRSYDERIDVIDHEDRIILKKKIAARKGDLRGLLFVTIMVAAIVVFGVFHLAKGGISGYADILPMAFLPLVAVMGLVLAKRYRKEKADLNNERSLEITGKHLSLFENGEPRATADIAGLSYYWQTDEYVKVTLIIKLLEGELIKLDEDGDNKELLYLADKIAVMAEVKIHFINGETPTGSIPKL